MKILLKSRYWLIVLLGLFFAACSRDDYPQTIVGTWQTDHYHLKLQAIGAPADNEKIDLDITWVFSENGTISTTGLATLSGTYSLINDNKELYMEYFTGDTETWKIKKLNSNALKVVYVQQFSTGTATYKITFDRL